MALAFLFIPTMAQAVAPLPELDGLITDQAGVLTDRTEIEAAQTQFHNATGGNFYVVFIDSFGNVSPGDWAYDTGTNAGLGAKDVLWVWATDGADNRGEYWAQTGSDVAFNETQVAALEGLMDNSVGAAEQGATTWPHAVANIIGAFQNELVDTPAAPAEPAAPGEPAATAEPASPGVVTPVETGRHLSGGQIALIALAAVAALFALWLLLGKYNERRLARRAENPFNV